MRHSRARPIGGCHGARDEGRGRQDGDIEPIIDDRGGRCGDDNDYGGETDEPERQEDQGKVDRIARPTDGPPLAVMSPSAARAGDRAVDRLR